MDGRSSRMNITDFKATPISQVYASVSKLAHRHKVALAEGEVIGLIPEAACERESDDGCRLLSGFDRQPYQILEHRLEAPLGWPGEP